MPSKNFKLPYLHDVNQECVDLCDEIASIVDAIDEHLAKTEIPQEGALQTEGLFYTKVGEMVTVYGECTPTTAIVAKIPFKPVLHSGTMNMKIPAFRKSDGSLVIMGLTNTGMLLTNQAVREEMVMQFTYATLD